MKRQDAIKLLQTIKVNPDGTFAPVDNWQDDMDKDYQEALDKAIKWLTLFNVRGED